MYGRVDAEKYKHGLATCLNYIPTLQGALTRRPGTIFASEVKFSSAPTRLQHFEFSIVQAYVLEFGSNYIRYFKNGGLITNVPVVITAVTSANPVVVTATAHGFSNGDRVVIVGVVGMNQLNNREYKVANKTANTFELNDPQSTSITPTVDGTGYGAYVLGGTVAKVYETVTNYTVADIFQLKFTQSEDVLYIAHPKYPPAKLSRTGDTAWILTDIPFLDGPYTSANVAGTATLTPSAGTGTVTLTASSLIGINGGVGFKPTDIFRYIRLLNGTWAWGQITGYTSPTVVTFLVKSGNIGAVALPTWRMGLYSFSDGFPTCCTFHEARLLFGGAGNSPQRFDGSNAFDFENFAPTLGDGTTNNATAVGFTLDSNELNAMRWMSSDEKGLLCGTAGGEWLVKPATSDSGLTSTNVNAKQSTDWGSADIQSLKIGRTHLHVQRATRKLRELTFDFYVDGFDSQDMTLLSEHISGTGFVQLAHQAQPQSLVWAVRKDGVLCSMTYERDGQNVTAGWSRHILGGTSDAAGSQAVVESVSCIPSSDGTYDQVWVVVRRFINGRSARYVEYFAKIFEGIDEIQDAVFMDASEPYDNPKTVSSLGFISSSNVTVGAYGHGFSNGDSIQLTDIVGGGAQLNDKVFVILGVTTNTFDIPLTTLSNALSLSGGVARKLVSTISGLNYLEGQLVSILADGAFQPSVVVTQGVVNLSTPAAVIQMGLGYASDCQMMRLDAGAADGTAMGKTRRSNRVGFMLYQTLGFKYGVNFSELDEIVFRTAANPMNQAVPLFTGIKSELLSADYSFEDQICWRQDEPFPGTILAVFPQTVTQDRG